MTQTSPSPVSLLSLLAIALCGGGLSLTLAAVTLGIAIGFDKLPFWSLTLAFAIGVCIACSTAFLLQPKLTRMRQELQREFDQRTQELQQTSDRFVQYTETSTEWFWETDTENRFVFLSSRLFEVSGARPQDMLGYRREDLRPSAIDAEEEARWQSHLQDIAQRRSFENFYYRSIKANGDTVRYCVSGRPYSDKQGNFLGYRGVAYNATSDPANGKSRKYNYELIYQAMSALDDGFILFDSDDRMVMCNKRFRKLFSSVAGILEPGVTITEIFQLYTERYMNFVIESARKDWIERRLVAFNSNSDPFDLKLPNGDWLRISNQRLPSGGSVGLCIDITQIKRIENELQQAQSIAKVGSFRCSDATDRLIYCSEELGRIFELSTTELCAMSREQLDQFIHPDDLSMVREAYQQTRNTDAVVEVEYRIQRAEGEIRHVIERLSTSKWEQGEIIELVGTLQDITDRRQAESARISSDEVLEAAIENVPGGFLLVNTDGLIERYNQKFYDLYPEQQFFINEGIPFEKFLSHGIEAGVYQEALVNSQTWLRQRMARPKFETIEFIERLSDGRSIQIALRQLPNGSRVGMHVDVTELQKARDAAVKANEAKSDFLASMSHELRTPMHGILSFTELGLKRLETLSQGKLRQYLENIQISGTRLLYLLNDLLDLSKLEAGKMQLDVTAVDLAKLTASCVEEQELRMREKNLRCQVNAQESMARVVCDRNRILQVITNIVANAVKFSPENGEIQIDLEGNLAVCRVRVADQGLGIPAGELDQVFDKFYQSAGNRNQSGGTGLGLAVCREIIELHRGRIWAENNPEQGAAISFEIPLQPPSRD